MIIIGDLNGHIQGWFHSTTNVNGLSIQDLTQYWGMRILENNKSTFVGRNGEESCVDFAIVTPQLYENTRGHNTWQDCPLQSDHHPQITELVIPNKDSARVLQQRLRVALLK